MRSESHPCPLGPEAVSGLDQTHRVATGADIPLPAETRRLRWPLAAGLIVVMSVLLWVAVFQSMSWLGML